MRQKSAEKLYTLKEACELLSISTATGRNWIKCGRLVPSALQGRTFFFSGADLEQLSHALSSGKLPQLKGRRNKSFISGTQTFRTYIAKTSPNHRALQFILNYLSNEPVSVDETVLLCLLRDCAEKLICAAGIRFSPCYAFLLDDLIPSDEFARVKSTQTSLFEAPYTYVKEEDTLGFLYLSLCNLKDRKTSGSYYTPARLAKRLVETHLPDLDATQTILDPSCGTGMFLLQLPAHLPLSNLFGTDLNPVSVALTRINLAVKYRISTLQEAECLKRNIVVADFLQNKPEKDNLTSIFHNTPFHIIFGNPPWGARLSAKEKENYRRYFFCANEKSMETFDLFIEQSLNCLSKNGILSFVLPEAVLTVKAHTPVRELLLRSTHARAVEYLGEAFEQVHCPSIILTLEKNNEGPFCKNTRISTRDVSFSTNIEHVFSAEFFPFLQTDEEYLLLKKISSHLHCTTLVDNAVFALGIVTGNNSALLHSAPSPGTEPVIKGSDIRKYHINSCSGYLTFHPEQLQQTAPEVLYRAPEKLFYRFISRQLIFAYDNTGLLSLNSCNILIPQIKELSVKYVMAVLNSGVAQFVFEKSFHSVKVLRSHLEQIPIPLVNAKTQEHIVAMVDRLLLLDENNPEFQSLYLTLDRTVADLFHLSEAEYCMIKGETL